jgi:predicted nuclease of predicted toxin-antitoxin system
MRFLCDIPIGRETIEFLRAGGHDVAGVRDRLPSTASDPQIIDVAQAEQRVILCFDLDFAALVAVSRKRWPSVVTLRLSRHQSRYVNQRLGVTLPELVDLRAGFLAMVEDHRLRIRELPIAGA